MQKLKKITEPIFQTATSAGLLNSRTLKDAFTLLRIENTLDRLVGADILTNWISNMDLGRGFKGKKQHETK